MALGIGQTSKFHGNAASGATTAVTVAAGSTVVVGFGWNNNGGTFSSITDSAGGTPVQLDQQRGIGGTGGNYQARFYYFENTSGGASYQVTVTLSAAALLTVFMVEVTGGATASILDQAIGAIDFSSPYSSGVMATTTNANDMLVAMMFGSSISNPATHAQSGGNPSSGWSIQSGAEETDGTTYITGASMTQVVAATGDYEGSWTESGSSGTAAFIAAFKAAATGIAFGAASNSGYQAASSSYSFARTISGSNTFLAVDVALLSAGQTVTSVIDDYDGTPVNLTFIGAQSTVSSVGRIESWGLVGPLTGTKNIQVNLSGSIASAATAASYTGVNQFVPTEAFNSAQATNVGAADATVSVTTVADNCWVHGAIATDDTAITANQTSRNNVTGVGGSSANEDNNAAKTPAGAVTMSYTNVGALATWAIAGYAIRPVAASSTTTLAPTVGAQTYAGATASLLLALSVTTGAILYSGNVPALTNLLAPTVGSQLYSGNAPGLLSAFVLAPTTGVVSYDGLPPTLSWQLVPTDGNIAFTGNTPSIPSIGTTHYSRRHGRCYYS